MSELDSEIAMRIAEARHSGIIDLNGLSLDVFPAAVFKCTKLKSIDLANNKLSSLPPEIASFTELQELLLNNNQITSLPTEIGQMTSLIWLRLHDNKLTSLPSEIGNLTALQDLGLACNELESVPAELGQCVGLQELFLYDNKLTTLPDELASLSNLVRLHIKNNNIPSLPASLSHLPVDVLQPAVNPLSSVLAQIQENAEGKAEDANEPNKTSEVNDANQPSEANEANAPSEATEASAAKEASEANEASEGNAPKASEANEASEAKEASEGNAPNEANIGSQANEGSKANESNDGGDTNEANEANGPTDAEAESAQAPTESEPHTLPQADETQQRSQSLHSESETSEALREPTAGHPTTEAQPSDSLQEPTPAQAQEQAREESAAKPTAATTVAAPSPAPAVEETSIPRRSSHWDRLRSAVKMGHAKMPTLSESEIRVQDMIHNIEAVSKEMINESQCDQNWTSLLTSGTNIEVFQKVVDEDDENGIFPMYKAVTTYKQKPSEVVDMISLRERWDANVMQADFVEAISSDVNVCHVCFNSKIMFVDNRDFCLLQGRYPMKPLPDGSFMFISSKEKAHGYVLAHTSVTHDACPETSDFVRGTVIQAGFVILPNEDGGSTVTHIHQTDYGGSLPRMMTRVLNDSRIACLDTIRTMLDKESR